MANQKNAAWLLGLGFVAMFLSCAFKGVFQVYFNDVAAWYGRGRADFGLVGGLFLLVSGLASPLVGALADRFGPLRTVLLGSVLGGGALLALAWQPHQYWLFVAGYGVVAAFALAAMSYVPLGVLVDRVCSARQAGLGYALVSNGSAIGFIVLSPLWLWLQPQLAWHQLFGVLGTLFAGPLALLWWWAGRLQLPRAAPVTAAEAARADWRAVLADHGFYVLALGFIGCGASMAFIDLHLVPLWQDHGAARSAMGFSLSLLGILELGSGLAAGWLATRYPQHWLLGAFYLLRGLALALLLADATGVITYGFAALFGASYLGTVVLTSALCLSRYGAAVKGQVFGVLFMLHQGGAFVSAQFGAWGYDRWHSYQPLIVALLALTGLAGVACCGWLRRPRAQLAAESA